MNITIHDIKIKIKLFQSEKLLAQATVIIDDIWEEHGWRVMKSDRYHPIFQEEVWVQAPSYQSYGKWREIVFINDRNLYERVQEKIYDAYHMAKTKEDGQKSIKEVVDPKDIPL
jgi:DNA-binding cell septation regulator SpoVG